MVFRLILTALYNAFLAVLIYLAEKKTALGKLSYKTRQLVIGLLFGAMAAFASTGMGGVDIGDGTIMNVRDAAPLCAGLIFGAPAGVIAGLIGGAFRYITAFFGLTGTYTQLACSISTALAGLIAALLRKFMFDDKKPSWLYGLGVGVICEIIHMLMIFFTNANDPATAFNFVKICSLPMMLCNGFSVGVAVLAISLIGKEKNTPRLEEKHLSRTFQMWLFFCIAIAYALTGVYTYVLQSNMSDTEIESVIRTSINDVNRDISDTSDENLLNKATLIQAEYLASADKNDEFLRSIAAKYNVAEVHVVGPDGRITASNVPDYVGFDMASGKQSEEFLVLLEGNLSSYVQQYRPQSYNSGVSRKYGAVTLPDGGFLQVGYDAEGFRADMESAVMKITRNRHIGESGFVAAYDGAWTLLGQSFFQDQAPALAELGAELSATPRGDGKIFSAALGGTPYLCEYQYVEGYYILGVIPEAEARFMRDVSVYLSSFMEILIFSALFVLVYFLIKRLVIDNLNQVNRALSKIANGNLNVTVDVRANEEFASLSDDINSTVDALKRYIDEAAARIDAELEFARQIQHSALPSVFPPYPNRREFDLYAQMDTAKEVGGDFYDFYMLDDSTIAFLIADVSGKGIPAAMFMMKAKTILKDLAERGLEVDEIFTQANQKLCENNDAGMFVTAWMAIVDLKTGLMRVANAGHNPPVISRRTGGEEAGAFAYEKLRAGFVLAGMEGLKYRKTEIQLFPGDRVYLYTDGVTEATNSDAALYGENRLLETLNAHRDADGEALCQAVKADVDAFAGDAPQFDDITMLSFTLNFIKGENKLVFIPDAAAGAAVSDFADQLTARLNVLPKTAGKVSVAIDEIASNIINYSQATLAEIYCAIESGKLRLTFADNGVAYDPMKAQDPDVTLSAEERQIGGLGIFMVKKMAQSMEYQYENGKNILSVVIALDV